MRNHKEYWLDPLFNAKHAQEGVASQCAQQFEHVLDVWLKAIRAGGKLIFFGNGGSQAMAQHFAAECVVRLKRNRKPISAIALGTDAATMTAVCNDMAADKVFARQIEAIGRQGDACVALTTSGASANVLAGVEQANSMGIASTALLGATLGIMPPLAATIMIPNVDTARIQEMHLLVGHMLIAALEKELNLV